MSDPERAKNLAKARRDNRGEIVPDGPVSVKCRESFHLWCKGKAGQHNAHECGCECHQNGVPRLRR